MSNNSSGDSCLRLRGVPFSIITSSSFRARTASQDWCEKQGQLYRRLRRKPEARCPAVGKRLMSSPHSAISICAVRSATPAIAHSTSTISWCAGEHLLDLLVRHQDRMIKRVDVRDQLHNQDPVMVDLEGALKRPRAVAGSSRASGPSPAPPAVSARSRRTAALRASPVPTPTTAPDLTLVRIPGSCTLRLLA
jgi:hypothetical protein